MHRAQYACLCFSSAGKGRSEATRPLRKAPKSETSRFILAAGVKLSRPSLSEHSGNNNDDALGQRLSQRMRWKAVRFWQQRHCAVIARWISNAASHIHLSGWSPTPSSSILPASPSLVHSFITSQQKETQWPEKPPGSR